MGKPDQRRLAKFGEKREKGKSKKQQTNVFIFFSKDVPLIHLIHPKVKKYIPEVP
jgi:hypothetical protein